MNHSDLTPAQVTEFLRLVEDFLEGQVQYPALLTALQLRFTRDELTALETRARELVAALRVARDMHG